MTNPAAGDGLGTGIPLPRGPEDRNGQARRRVALFTGNYNHIADGVSLTLNRLVAYLEANGHTVRVFAPTIDEPALDHEGTLVPVRSVPFPGRAEYRLSLGLPRSVRDDLTDFAPDLVHLATPDLLGHAALRWAKAHELPIVASYHTHFPSYFRYYKLGWIEGLVWKGTRRFYNRCDLVYVPTRTMANTLANHGVETEMAIWARGVERDRFDPARRSSAWRAQLGFAPDDVVVTFVSRLVTEKGLDVFGDVIEGLQQRGIPHRALVVGDGPAGDELRQRLPEAVFTGHLGGADLATAYASSDVFLFPSETETFGNVILEAMASGLPAVVADAAGGADLVLDGETGFICPPHDRACFLDRTARLVQDATLRQRFGAQARERSAHYQWDAILARVVHGYDQAVLGTAPASTTTV